MIGAGTRECQDYAAGAVRALPRALTSPTTVKQWRGLLSADCSQRRAVGNHNGRAPESYQTPVPEFAQDAGDGFASRTDALGDLLVGQRYADARSLAGLLAIGR